MANTVQTVNMQNPSADAGVLEMFRVATAVPSVSVADVSVNTERIYQKAKEADRLRVQLTVFPELALTGYTCEDLFFQRALWEDTKKGLRRLIEASAELQTILVFGLPFVADDALYNCAAVVQGGKLYGIIPKTFIPNYNEFYEARWFSSATALKIESISPAALGIADLQTEPIPIGRNLLFNAGILRFGAEICEDIWATVPQSSFLSLHGAEMVLNLSASNDTIGKHFHRRVMVAQHSSAQMSAYVYVSAGCSESTSDLIFSGHSLICSGGKILAENERIIDDDYLLCADVDLGKLRVNRLKVKTFSQSAALLRDTLSVREIAIPCSVPADDLAFFSIRKMPFVPEDSAVRAERCKGVFEMQVMSLKKRLEITGARPVVGVSGGLDSTLALLVSAEAVRRLGKPLTDVVGITMPCFGTSDRTYKNAWKLMRDLGITALEIPIRRAVEGHFADIGQDPEQHDLTYENAQARERTQVLMDYAGKIGGLVIGTGDMSELALGWCTYNADHMSMYGVNCGIPKTMVRWVIDAVSTDALFASCRETLCDILDTPISPELLPPDEKGKIAQQTEDIVGPYALHDFFLYYTVRFGFTPEKVYALAVHAFRGEYGCATVKKWLIQFYRRFFTQQYKRACQPDGVKIGSVCLGSHGDWRMPSDASAAAWVARAQALPTEADN